MFHKTLHGKLSLILFGLLCLFGCLSLPLTLLTTQRYQQEVAQKLNRPLAASLATHLAAKHLLSQDSTSLQKARAEIKYLMVINPDIDVYLLDGRGDILAYSDAPDKVKRDRVALAPLRRFLDGSAPLPILGDEPCTAGMRTIFSVAPIPADPSRPRGQDRGYVYVILGGEQSGTLPEELGRSYALRSSAIALAAIIVLVSAAGLLLFRLLTRRLRWLTAATETFREQDDQETEAVLTVPPSNPWPNIVPPRDEIDRLGIAHVEMAKRIRGQMLALAQADTHRREMVSNVSHDLRTPLAALQGYLETLLMKEGRLTPEEQRDYLQIALRHSERLARMVGELFELARLDSREVQLNSEAFSLAELVQDVVQQHQLVAEQGRLRLQALFPENLPFVYADIGMIERVIVNLLENALRYTPEGGSVTIGLTPQAGKVEVSVSDTGSGIRREDLPHIFERFYRVAAQPEKPGCAGLGLAIAKRILELHGSTIEVESTLDQGTSFTFRLPVAAAPDGEL